jgi:serine/threonine protein kinase
MNESVKIGGGAFANVFLDKDGNVVKRYRYDEKKDAAKEIDILNIIKKNRKAFKKQCEQNLGFAIKSSIITIKGWFVDKKEDCRGEPCVKLKKYISDLNSFNKLYIQKSGKLLDYDIVKHIHYKIMMGLAELEFSDIIHGDLKPENVLVGFTGIKNSKGMSLEKMVNFIIKEEVKEGGVQKIIKHMVVKIIDFNKSLISSSVMKSLNIQTIYYTPPEIVIGIRDYNNSVDIWTASCILYEMLTGKYLFNVFNKDSIYSNDNSKEESGNSGSDDSVDGDSSDVYEYDDSEKFNHLGLLHLYRCVLGEIPQDMLEDAENKEEYFCNNILIGSCGIQLKSDNYIQKFNNFFDIIFSRTFNYNYKNRLSIEEYYCLYLRNIGQ